MDFSVNFSCILHQYNFCSCVAVWRSGNGVRHISEVTLHRARLVLRWVTIRGYTVYYVTCRSGQLSLLSQWYGSGCLLENSYTL